MDLYPSVIDKYSYIASKEEIEENSYNLNISRYVDTFEEEEMVDMDHIKKEISSIREEIKEVEAIMNKYLEALGV